MNVEQITNALESIAPLHYAEDWDNVGLLVGSGQWQTDRILLTIDLTEPVLREARETGAGLIVAYHPPIFQPLPRLTDTDARQEIILQAARAGIAIHSPHTALDAAPGGVNDWLAEGLGHGDVRALQAHAELPVSEECKLVTFCPTDAVEQLRNGLATIGAGQIGRYQLCSFQTEGTGTFLGAEGTSPNVGRPGQLERVKETRLEMVCPRRSLALAVSILAEFHPYEEPPIEIHRLEPRPQRRTGHGRRVLLDQKVALGELVQRIKKRLGVERVRVALARRPPRRYGSVGLCAGAGGALLDAAVAQQCQIFLTGEMRHHDVLAAQAAGCAVILAGHTNTERGYLRRLRKQLRERLPDATIVISRRDSDPLRSM